MWSKICAIVGLFVLTATLAACNNGVDSDILQLQATVLAMSVEKSVEKVGYKPFLK